MLVCSGGVAGAVVTLAVPYVVLPVLGFGAAGVTAGSVAAGWMASVGNVAAGRNTSRLQY